MHRVSFSIIAILFLASITVGAKAKKIGDFDFARRKAESFSVGILPQGLAKQQHKEVRLLIKVDNTFNSNDLRRIRGRVISRAGDILSVGIKRAFASQVSKLQGVISVEFPRELFPTMDSVRIQTGTDYVHGELLSNLPQSYKGKGILIGVMDTEFDHHHEAFLNESGGTRFIGIWDQTIETQVEQNPYGYGVIKNQSELDQDTSFGLSSRVHGTHMAGAAVGSGYQTGYQGVAPEAMVAGVRYAGTSSELLNGIQWLFHLADSLDVPCVVNMSIGVATGPHDGTSLLDEGIDQVSGPGRIVVGAVGNDGDKSAHISFDMGRSDQRGLFLSSLSYLKESSDENSEWFFSGVDIWSEKQKSFSISCLILDTTNLQYLQAKQAVSTTLNGTFKPDTIISDNPALGRPDTTIVQVDVEAASGLNGKAHAQAVFFSNNPDLCLGVTVSTGPGPQASQTVHAWHWRKLAIRSFGIDGFYDGDNNYSVNEVGGTATRIITVGSWVSKREMILWTGEPFMTYDNGTVGDMPPFSGRGPTVDGRIKPDITAPGSAVVGAISRLAEWDNEIAWWPDTTNRRNRYGIAVGTSVSSPIVAGVIALMLQEDSTLTPEEIRTILQETAGTDQFTGAITTPNNQWGGGKVHALRAMQRLQNLTASKRRFSAAKNSGIREIRLVGTSSMNIDALPGTDLSGCRLRVMTLSGRTIALAASDKKGTVHLGGRLPTGTFLLRLENSQGTPLHLQKMVVTERPRAQM